MASAVPYGHGCHGTGGRAPRIGTSGTPRLGNAGFVCTIAGALPGSPAILLLCLDRLDLPRPGGCVLQVDVTRMLTALVAPVGAAGDGSVSLPVPVDPALRGARLFGQYIVVDPGGANGGLLAYTDGLSVVLASN